MTHPAHVEREALLHIGSSPKGDLKALVHKLGSLSLVNTSYYFSRKLPYYIYVSILIYKYELSNRDVHRDFKPEDDLLDKDMYSQIAGFVHIAADLESPLAAMPS
ncbi:hypothetical protein BDQ12DRAFT_668454 [Crucibulum laeve]|uniref:Uncharacterized protein n=1 Tax=Crucibulum laeve TaxID=68775 RepID=A0A5C3LR71_9AGAR|nr:hypothetical protein BDQ12DRAFT_668454 [Crucibulum laeve]